MAGKLFRITLFNWVRMSNNAVHRRWFSGVTAKRQKDWQKKWDWSKNKKPSC